MLENALFKARFLTLSLFLLISIGCSDDNNGLPEDTEEPSAPATNALPESEKRTLQIRDHKQECSGVFVFPCLYTKIPGETNWNLFYDSIVGFEYEWGYNYEVEVAVTSIENPPADGSSVRYTLLNTVSQTPVLPGSQFEYSSRFASEVITKKSEDTYSLFSFEAKDFICAPADCDTLDALLMQNKSILFEFRHPDELEDALVLERIICSDILESFHQTCVQAQSIPDTSLDIELLLLDQFNQATTTFNQSETVTFSFSATNNTTNPISLEFSSGQRYDIFIQNEGKTEIWRWSGDKVFTQTLQSVESNPGEAIQELAEWNQILSDGIQISPGNYIASGYYHDQSNTVDIAFTTQ